MSVYPPNLENSFALFFQRDTRPNLVVLPDSPKFTIVECNKALSNVLGESRSYIIGKGVFEVFPWDVNDRHANGGTKFVNYLEKILLTKKELTINALRYDILSKSLGAYNIHYWEAQLFPIMEENNEDIKHIVISATDITERVMAERKLWASEQRLQRLFDEAPFSMAIALGKDLIFERANQNYYKLTGRNEDIIGEKVQNVFPELAGQGFFEWLDKVYNTGETFFGNEIPLSIVKENSNQMETVYINFTYQAYRDEKGKIAGVFYFGYEVTEQVLARKKIEEKEKLYENLIHNLPAPVYTIDNKGKILLYNKEAISLWGNRPRKNKKWIGVDHVYDSKGNKLSMDQTPIMECIQSQKKIRNKEIIYEKNDGTLVNVLPFPTPLFDSYGELTGAVNILWDITESKQKQKELKVLSLIATNTKNAVIITNKLGTIEWVNDAFQQITEYSFKEAIGKKSNELLHGSGTDKISSLLIEKKREKGTPFTCEILKYKKSGESIWVEVKGQPIFDDDGELSHYFQIEEDITQRKLAFEQMQRAERESKRFAQQINNLLEEERHRIAQEIHDEFGQHLSILKMSLARIKKKQNLSEIIEEMDPIMEDLDLAISSLRKLASDLRPRILDSMGLSYAIEWLAYEFEKKTGLKCVKKIQEVDFHLDKLFSISLYRICQEALTNVMKHAEATEVHIHFQVIEKELFLSICDNGIGFNNEEQSNEPTMGLLGVKERANAIGGILEIHSSSGNGAMIKVVAAIPEN